MPAKQNIFLTILLSWSICNLQAQKQNVCPEKNGPYTHIVKKGETLMAIGRQYHVDAEKLKTWNKIQNSKSLRVCQRILLIAPDDFKKRAAKKDTRLPGDGILPLALSNRYKQRIDSMNALLALNFSRNTSGELEFYLLRTQFGWSTWLYPETHFNNTEAELQVFLDEMARLNVILQKNTLTKTDKQSLGAIPELLDTFPLRPVHADGSTVRRKGAKIDPLPAMPKVQIAGWKMQDKNAQPLAFSNVYRIKPRDFATCPCTDCFFDKQNACDFNDLLEIAASSMAEGEGELRVPLGPFHFFVTRRTGSVEKIIHYEKRKITEADEGKTIVLKVPGY